MNKNNWLEIILKRQRWVERVIEEEKLRRGQT